MIKVGDKVKITGDTCYHGFNTGDVVTCVTAGIDGVHKFSDGEFNAWAASKDYTPYEPTTGTLAEIGAQVGDVVSNAVLGVKFEIKLIEDGIAYGTSFDDEASLDDAWFMHGSDDWRIITRSRAKPQGPVITETVKRIVPGVYGKVEVTTESANDFFNVVVHPCLSRADLIAARDVFNQLIDAMPDE